MKTLLDLFKSLVQLAFYILTFIRCSVICHIINTLAKLDKGLKAQSQHEYKIESREER